MDVTLRLRSIECYGEDISFILDINTRWNSLVRMLERFLRMQKALSLALVDLGGEIHFSAKDWAVMDDLVKVLVPIETTVLHLCGNKANLLTADISVDCLLDNLPNGEMGEKCGLLYCAVFWRDGLFWRQHWVSWKEGNSLNLGKYLHQNKWQDWIWNLEIWNFKSNSYSS